MQQEINLNLDNHYSNVKNVKKSTRALTHYSVLNYVGNVTKISTLKSVSQKPYIPPWPGDYSKMSSGAHGATKTSATHPAKRPLYILYIPPSPAKGVYKAMLSK